ncbi:MAG: hypothetical protein KDA27_04525 [Candidatus Eisenbacteria bacterium]|uniref:Fibronectin type-III domain-containing protein n=1 Tax=Eiseniibacteriota bacterium TaxID=2212470 RepID=A0A956SC74_UNCEI|nr:hypothetical protein [Candidatus Eisenbacteria bacterium]
MLRTDPIGRQMVMQTATPAVFGLPGLVRGLVRVLLFVAVLLLPGCGDDDDSIVEPSATTGDLHILVTEGDAAGPGAGGAWVVLDVPGVPGQMSTDTGAVEFADLDPGYYRVVASRNGAGGGVAVSIEAGRTTESTIPLRQGLGLEPQITRFEPADDVEVTVGIPILFEGTVEGTASAEAGVTLSLEENGDTVWTGVPGAGNRYSFSVESSAKGTRTFSFRATDPFGFVAVDTVDVVVTMPAPVLYPPTVRSGAVRLSWAGVEDAELSAYEVYRAEVVNGQVGEGELVATLPTPTETAFEDGTYPRGGVLEYRIRAVDSSGNESWSEGEDVRAPAGTLSLDSWYGDAVLHPSQPWLFVAAPDLRTIYCFDYETEEIVGTIEFEYRVERLAIGDTGLGLELYATLPARNHDWTWDDEDQYGYLGIIDPDALTVTEVRLIDLDPFDVLPGRDGYLYVSSGSGQHTKIRSYPRTGQAPSDDRPIYQGSLLALHPVYDRIYTTGGDHTSMDVRDGQFVSIRTNDTWGAWLAIEPSGRFLFTDSGRVYRCDADPARDLLYFGMLPMEWTAIDFDSLGNLALVGERGVVTAISMESWEPVWTSEILIHPWAVLHRGNVLLAVGWNSTPYRTEVEIVRR